jgi:hypothetical protein
MSNQVNEDRTNSDDKITEYIEGRRALVDSFVARNFEMSSILKIPRNRLAKDFVRHLANSVVVLPYLALREAAQWLEKLGWDYLYKKTKALSPGFKTSLEIEFENLIYEQLFELAKSQGQDDSFGLSAHLREKLHEGLHAWVYRRATWIDLVSSVLIWLTGLLVFDDLRLGILGIGSKIAGWWSYRQSASEFFLGEGMGRVFYGVFPPNPSSFQVALFTVIFMGIISVISFGFTLVLDPVQKKLGLHQRNLHKLLDDLEVKLLLASRKQSRR